MVIALVLVGSMEQEGVGVVLRMLIESDARHADGELGNEVRCFKGKKGGKVLVHCLKSEFGATVGTDILMDRLRASLSKPVASWAARPTATGSMVGRRPPRPLWAPRWAREPCEPAKGGGGPLGKRE
jgi:hypothetical protein